MKTVILSADTARLFVEAHASMAAWYYQMAAVLRDAELAVEAPSEAQRLAFVKQIGQHFPEMAAIAETVTEPRAYVPPPAFTAPTAVTENEGVATPEPPADLISTPAMIRPPEAPAAPAAEPEAPGSAAPAAAAPASAAPPPPPMVVDPSKVKYEDGDD